VTWFKNDMALFKVRSIYGLSKLALDKADKKKEKICDNYFLSPRELQCLYQRVGFYFKQLVKGYSETKETVSNNAA